MDGPKENNNISKLLLLKSYFLVQLQILKNKHLNAKENCLRIIKYCKISGGGHFSAIERCKRKPKVSLLCVQGRGRNYDWIITYMMKTHTRYSLANKTKEPVLQNKSVAKVKSALSSLTMRLMEFLVNLDLRSMFIWMTTFPRVTWYSFSLILPWYILK